LDSPPPREETRWHDAACRFEVVFTVFSVRPCDWDGYDIKALQDFLITAGIIPDDGWKTLSGRVVSRKAATKDEERTEIEITEIVIDNIKSSSID
jgi:Holliday junction resolvase RusA-like endonuclease